MRHPTAMPGFLMPFQHCLLIFKSCACNTQVSYHYIHSMPVCLLYRLAFTFRANVPEGLLLLLSSFDLAELAEANSSNSSPALSHQRPPCPPPSTEIHFMAASRSGLPRSYETNDFGRLSQVATSSAFPDSTVVFCHRSEVYLNGQVRSMFSPLGRNLINR